MVPINFGKARNAVPYLRRLWREFSNAHNADVVITIDDDNEHWRWSMGNLTEGGFDTKELAHSSCIKNVYKIMSEKEKATFKGMIDQIIQAIADPGITVLQFNQELQKIQGVAVDNITLDGGICVMPDGIDLIYIWARHQSSSHLVEKKLSQYVQLFPRDPKYLAKELVKAMELQGNSNRYRLDVGKIEMAEVSSGGILLPTPTAMYDIARYAISNNIDAVIYALQELLLKNWTIPVYKFCTIYPNLLNNIFLTFDIKEADHQERVAFVDLVKALEKLYFEAINKATLDTLPDYAYGNIQVSSIPSLQFFGVTCNVTKRDTS
jgi:hypothetical protein